MKKIFLLSFFLLLFSCNEKTNNTNSSETNNEENITNPKGIFPIVKKPISLKIMLSSDDAQDISENTMTKWIEQKTGIHLEFITFPSDITQEKLNLAFINGDLPDIFMDMGFEPDQLSYYGDANLILPLDKYIEEYGQEFQRANETVSWFTKSLRSGDGHIYDLPDLNEAYHATMSKKAWIRKDWLKKLNIDIPTTTEEFEKMLIAFKDQDPNGNGLKDEIPMSGANISWDAGANIDEFLMNSFIINNSTRLRLKDGIMSFIANTKKWREGLRYIKGLYDKGLFNDTTFTQNMEQFQQLAKANPPILGVALTGYATLLDDFAKPEDFTTPENIFGNEMDYIALKPLKGPSGIQQTTWDPYMLIRGAFVISATTKYPEAAYRLGDFLLSEEASLTNMLGSKGLKWDYFKDEGIEKTEALLGGKARIDLITTDEWMQRNNKTKEEFNVLSENDTWIQKGPSFRPFKGLRADLEKGYEPFHYYLDTETFRAYEPFKQDIKTVIPPLSYSIEEAEALIEIRDIILNYVNESLARFIRGEDDLDKDWDKYINTLKDMRVDEYIKINQEAYDKSSFKEI